MGGRQCYGTVCVVGFSSVILRSAIQGECTQFLNLGNSVSFSLWMFLFCDTGG